MILETVESQQINIYKYITFTYIFLTLLQFSYLIDTSVIILISEICKLFALSAIRSILS